VSVAVTTERGTRKQFVTTNLTAWPLNTCAVYQAAVRVGTLAPAVQNGRGYAQLLWKLRNVQNKLFARQTIFAKGSLIPHDCDTCACVTVTFAWSRL
jgi:hypothetical protein